MHRLQARLEQQQQQQQQQQRWREQGKAAFQTQTETPAAHASLPPQRRRYGPAASATWSAINGGVGGDGDGDGGFAASGVRHVGAASSGILSGSGRRNRRYASKDATTSSEHTSDSSSESFSDASPNDPVLLRQSQRSPPVRTRHHSAPRDSTVHHTAPRGFAAAGGGVLVGSGGGGGGSRPLPSASKREGQRRDRLDVPRQPGLVAVVWRLM